MCDACDYSDDERPLFIAEAPIAKGEIITLEFPAASGRALARHVLPSAPVHVDVRPAWRRRVSRITAGEYRAFGLGVAVTLFLYGLQALL